MKFLHKFKTILEFQNSVYFPETEKPTVEAIVVGGVTYYYSEPGDNNYHIWVNPENSEQWVDSDGKRNPAVGDIAYVLGETRQSIESIIEYENTGESEENVEYEQPWVGWVYGTDNVSYNKYNLNGHDYVDLGLPSCTLWATCNVGADSPEELGDRYAWGETSTKSSFTWNNYRFYNDGEITKYYAPQNHTKSVLNIEYLTELESEDDAVNLNMGGNWYIPTPQQWAELFENTDHKSMYDDPLDEINGTYGIKFISKTDSSKFIFIPFSGYMDGTTIVNPGELMYWSNSMYDNYNNSYGDECASSTYFNGDAGFSINNQNHYKYCGLPVRGCINPNISNSNQPT